VFGRVKFLFLFFYFTGAPEPAQPYSPPYPTPLRPLSTTSTFYDPRLPRYPSVSSLSASDSLLRHSPRLQTPFLFRLSLLFINHVENLSKSPVLYCVLRITIQSCLCPSHRLRTSQSAQKTFTGLALSSFNVQRSTIIVDQTPRALHRRPYRHYRPALQLTRNALGLLHVDFIQHQ